MIKWTIMDEPKDIYVRRNNYNYALNEEFDYLDELAEELKKNKLSYDQESKEKLQNDDKKSAGSDKKE